MPELIPTKDEAAWLAARRNGITASEIAVLMGLSPYSSPYALYHQKLGILPQQDDSAVMERGRVLEPYIREKFALAHGEYAVLGDGRQLYAHSARPWMMATPDAVVHALAESECCTCGAGLDGYGHERGCGWELDAPVAVLECKVDGGSDEWGDEGTDEIPVHYRAQVIWQMDVMGVHTAHVACLNVPRWQVREYVIEHGPRCAATRDAPFGPDCQVCGDLVLMLEAAQEFRSRVEREDPPEVDWRPATLGALKQLHPSLVDEDREISGQLARWYRAACANAKEQERKKKLYEARIRQAIGPARRAVHAGVAVARRDVYEVKAHQRRSSTVDKLVPINPKEKNSASSDDK